MRLHLAILTLCAAVWPGCGPKAHDYGSKQIVRLKAAQPAPWAGWLVSDAELEFLLKQASRE